MKVILNEDIAHLGEEGDVKEVSSGYARNYLLRKKLVLEYNAYNCGIIDSRREEIEKRKKEKHTHAQSVKARLEAEPVCIRMNAGANGKLFGAVTSANIADTLLAEGIEIERKRIEVPGKSIKMVGTYKIRVRLYGENDAVLLLQVKSDAPENEELADAGDTPQPDETTETPKVSDVPAAQDTQEQAEEIDGERLTMPTSPTAQDTQAQAEETDSKEE